MYFYFLLLFFYSSWHYRRKPTLQAASCPICGSQLTSQLIKQLRWRHSSYVSAVCPISPQAHRQRCKINSNIPNNPNIPSSSKQNRNPGLYYEAERNEGSRLCKCKYKVYYFYWIFILFIELNWTLFLFFRRPQKTTHLFGSTLQFEK